MDRQTVQARLREIEASLERAEPLPPQPILVPADVRAILLDIEKGLARIEAEEWEKKFNPYHEEGTGRFTSEEGAGFVSLFGKPTRERAAEAAEANATARYESQRRVEAARAKYSQSAESMAVAQRAVDWSVERWDNLRKSADASGNPIPPTVERRFHDELEAGRTALAEAKAGVTALAQAEEQYQQEQAGFRTGVVGRGKDLPEDYSPERMAAKRDAMVNAAFDRLVDISNRQQASQKTYDRAGDEYQAAALAQRQAIETATVAFDTLDRAYSDRLAAKDAGELAAADARIANLEREYQRAEGLRSAANENMTREIKEFNDADQAYRQQYAALDGERKGLNTEMREKFIEPIGSPRALPVSEMRVELDAQNYPTAGPYDNPPAIWKTGQEALGRLIGQGAIPDTAHVSIKNMLPNDSWFAGGRSYHNGGSGGRSTITMHPGETDPGVVVHEMGHFVENAIPGATERIWQHIDSRTQGESNRKLSEITGHSGYKDDEVAKADKFIDAYMGKDYNHRASEFLSMSLQHLYTDPVEFARKDPQSFDFTMQLLAEARSNGGKLPMP